MTMTNDNKLNTEKDKVTGVETTGHEWDGLKELNNPAPRWWLWLFFVTIIWSVGYWFVYPAWPTIQDATKGSIGWTQYKQLAESQAEIMARKGEFLNKIEKASLNSINKDEKLFEFAKRGGEVAFKTNCAACHGTGAEGSIGYPNLNDDDWLWGGDLNNIYHTIKYGIRAEHDETRMSDMPAFKKDGILNKDEIKAVTNYVHSLSGKEWANASGKKLFEENCASCHGDKGQGNQEMGAPNLSDAIWLYGSSKKDIKATISNSRKGMMPSWEGKLDEATIKSLAIYVHSLGGGK